MFNKQPLTIITFRDHRGDYSKRHHTGRVGDQWILAHKVLPFVVFTISLTRCRGQKQGGFPLKSTFHTLDLTNQAI
jgi:hypothetical protein